MISLKYLITIPKNYNPSGADNHLKDFLEEYIFYLVFPDIIQVAGPFLYSVGLIPVFDLKTRLK